MAYKGSGSGSARRLRARHQASGGTGTGPANKEATPKFEELENEADPTVGQLGLSQVEDAGKSSNALSKVPALEHLSSGQKAGWAPGGAMDDFGLASAGTQVTFASCMDERHPPENIVDGSDRTFWITTGLFPHQIIMSFAAEIELDRIKTVTTNVRKLKFEACTQAGPTEFQEIYDVEGAAPWLLPSVSPSGSRPPSHTCARNLCQVHADGLPRFVLHSDPVVADRNGRVQSETNQMKGKPKARFLRVTVCSGWDDFASIRRISIDGAKT